MGTKILEPTITTVTAELFVVKIGNKQMTISVYNQLYMEDCWDKEYNIMYPVWGKINRDNEYVIFQKGNELRKCELPSKWKDSIYDEFCLRFIQNNFSTILSTLPQSNLTKEKEEALRMFRIVIYHHGSSFYKEGIEKATSFLDESFLAKLKKEFREESCLTTMQQKMVNELHNSRQLFISV